MANEEDKLIKTETEVVETFEFKGIVFTKTTTTVKKADDGYPEWRPGVGWFREKVRETWTEEDL